MVGGTTSSNPILKKSKIKWMWDSSNNSVKKWEDFEEKISKEIEDAYINKKPILKVKIHNQKYIINVYQRLQINEDSGKVRSINRDETLLKRYFSKDYVKTINFVHNDLKNVDWQKILGYKRVYSKDNEYKEDDLDFLGEPLGDGKEKEVVKISCGCIFSKTDAISSMMNSPKCPNVDCVKIYPVPGPQPSGSLTISEIDQFCEGHEEYATIKLFLNFPSGIQTLRMKNDGEEYNGRVDYVYIPSGPFIETEKILTLIVQVFIKGHTMYISDSLSTNLKNRPTWGIIHHKTSRKGGSSRHGWPDEKYYERCLSECANKLPIIKIS